MNIKWLLLSVLFVTTACQSLQNTNVETTLVILFFNEGIKPAELELTLQQLKTQINIDHANIEEIVLIRQSNNKQLIVNVISKQPKNDWLTKIKASTLIEYAEFDVKKMPK